MRSHCSRNPKMLLRGAQVKALSATCTPPALTTKAIVRAVLPRTVCAPRCSYDAGSLRMGSRQSPSSSMCSTQGNSSSCCLHLGKRHSVRMAALATGGQNAPPMTSTLPPRARIAVFLSGGGSNFKAVHAACLDGRINGDVVVRPPGTFYRRLKGQVSWHTSVRQQHADGLDDRIPVAMRYVSTINGRKGACQLLHVVASACELTGRCKNLHCCSCPTLQTSCTVVH